MTEWGLEGVVQNISKNGSYSQEKSLFFKLQSIKRNQYAVSTIGTILKRILQKECAVSKRKGLHHIFIPLVSREDYFQIIEEQDLSKVSGKIENLIASFYGKDTLTSKQAEKLREMLKEMKND